MKRFSIISFAVMIFLFMTSVPVLSEDLDKTLVPQQGASVCKADIKKFCKDVKPGDGRLWACLESHEKQLAKACRNLMAEKTFNRRNRSY